MSRMGLLRRVGEARRRLRDAAAGDLAGSDTRLQHTQAEQASADDQLSSLLDDAAARFARVQAASGLMLADEEREAATLHLVRTGQAVQLAAAEREKRRVQLERRERELRTTEKLLEAERVERRHDERRGEQALADDLGGAKAWREP